MRLRVFVASAAVCLSLLGGCSLHSGLAPSEQQKMEKELPVGSTREQIEAWLGGQGVEFQFSNDPRSASCVSLLPDAASYSGMVVGHMRDRSVIAKETTRMYFLLGGDGRLARTLVERSTASP